MKDEQLIEAYATLLYALQCEVEYYKSLRYEKAVKSGFVIEGLMPSWDMHGVDDI